MGLRSVCSRLSKYIKPLVKPSTLASHKLQKKRHPDRDGTVSTRSGPASTTPYIDPNSPPWGPQARYAHHSSRDAINTSATYPMGLRARKGYSRVFAEPGSANSPPPSTRPQSRPLATHLPSRSTRGTGLFSRQDVRPTESEKRIRRKLVKPYPNDRSGTVSDHRGLSSTLVATEPSTAYPSLLPAGTRYSSAGNSVSRRPPQPSPPARRKLRKRTHIEYEILEPPGTHHSTGSPSRPLLGMEEKASCDPSGQLSERKTDSKTTPAQRDHPPTLPADTQRRPIQLPAGSTTNRWSSLSGLGRLRLRRFNHELSQDRTSSPSEGTATESARSRSPSDQFPASSNQEPPPTSEVDRAGTARPPFPFFQLDDPSSPEERIPSSGPSALGSQPRISDTPHQRLRDVSRASSPFPQPGAPLSRRSSWIDEDNDCLVTSDGRRLPLISQRPICVQTIPTRKSSSGLSLRVPAPLTRCISSFLSMLKKPFTFWSRNSLTLDKPRWSEQNDTTVRATFWPGRVPEGESRDCSPKERHERSMHNPSFIVRESSRMATSESSLGSTPVGWSDRAGSPGSPGWEGSGRRDSFTELSSIQTSRGNEEEEDPIVSHIKARRTVEIHPPEELPYEQSAVIHDTEADDDGPGNS